MKTLPENLTAHLASGATTLCTCWKLTLAAGPVLGFTDHDKPLSFDAVSFEPSAGFSASAIETGLGLNVDNLEVIGALQSNTLNETDLAAGRIDNAEIEIWRVNWDDVAQRVLLRKGNLGEISRSEHAFVAEVRGLAHILNQPTGRLYQHTCDVDVGSTPCGVDLTGAAYKGTGTVSSVTSKREFSASGLDTYQSDWFADGKLVWQSGANTGRAMEVKAHGVNAGIATIALWQSMAADIAVDDVFEITVGCDKTLATCKAKFANVVNFRGMPHMPGNDFVLSYPKRGNANTGGSLVGN